MDTSDYKRILEKQIKRFATLTKQREGVDLEIAKSRQFIYATANMLPDAARKELLDKFEELEIKDLVAEASLIDSIRVVLQEQEGKWLTVANVRDSLVRKGFDFSAYTSNALSSVSTTLRRMKDHGEAESHEIEGVKVYRGVPAKLSRSRKRGFIGGALTMMGTED